MNESSLLQLLVLSCGLFSPGPVFEFRVRHHHLFNDCRGTLGIFAQGIEYHTSHKEDGRKWSFEELRMIKISSPSELSLVTYEDQERFLGKDRIFEFTLMEGKIEQSLSAFLLDKVKKPMTLAVVAEGTDAVFEIPVKHLQTLGGARGVLRLYTDRVVFQSVKEKDSRVWRLGDIQGFAQPDRFRIQIRSFVPAFGGPTEVYNFQLLDDLPEGVYDFLWVRLHPSAYYPAATGSKSGNVSSRPSSGKKN